MFVGLDHYINDRLYLNFEGRTNFNDGWGIEGGIGYMFDICAKPARARARARTGHRAQVRADEQELTTEHIA